MINPYYASNFGGLILHQLEVQQHGHGRHKHAIECCGHLRYIRCDTVVINTRSDSMCQGFFCFFVSCFLSFFENYIEHGIAIKCYINNPI